AIGSRTYARLGSSPIGATRPRRGCKSVALVVGSVRQRHPSALPTVRARAILDDDQHRRDYPWNGARIFPDLEAANRTLSALSSGRHGILDASIVDHYRFDDRFPVVGYLP